MSSLLCTALLIGTVSTLAVVMFAIATAVQGSAVTGSPIVSTHESSGLDIRADQTRRDTLAAPGFTLDVAGRRFARPVSPSPCRPVHGPVPDHGGRQDGAEVRARSRDARRPPSPPPPRSHTPAPTPDAGTPRPMPASFLPASHGAPHPGQSCLAPRDSRPSMPVARPDTHPHPTGTVCDPRPARRPRTRPITSPPPPTGPGNVPSQASPGPVGFREDDPPLRSVATSASASTAHRSHPGGTRPAVRPASGPRHAVPLLLTVGIAVALATVLTVTGAGASSLQVPTTGIDGAMGVLAWLADTIEDLLMIVQDTVEGWTGLTSGQPCPRLSTPTKPPRTMRKHEVRGGFPPPRCME